MIKVEIKGNENILCECCNQPAVQLTRELYNGDDLYTRYKIEYTASHDPKIAHGIVCLGNWEGDSKPNERIVFPFKVKSLENDYHVMFADRSESPWRNEFELGRMLNREEALRHLFKKEAADIISYILESEKSVTDYMEGKSN